MSDIHLHAEKERKIWLSMFLFCFVLLLRRVT